MKTLKIIGIVIGTMISLAVIGMAGYGVYRLTNLNHEIHAQNLRAAKDMEIHVAALRQVTAVPPATAKQRDQLADLGERLVKEIEVASASITYMAGNEDAIIAKTTTIAHDLKLLAALGIITKDGKLDQREYKAWKNFHQARHEEDSPQQTAFDRAFKWTGDSCEITGE